MVSLLPQATTDQTGGGILGIGKTCQEMFRIYNEKYKIDSKLNKLVETKLQQSEEYKNVIYNLIDIYTLITNFMDKNKDPNDCHKNFLDFLKTDENKYNYKSIFYYKGSSSGDRLYYLSYLFKKPDNLATKLTNFVRRKKKSSSSILIPIFRWYNPLFRGNILNVFSENLGKSILAVQAAIDDSATVSSETVDETGSNEDDEDDENKKLKQEQLAPEPLVQQPQAPPTVQPSPAVQALTTAQAAQTAQASQAASQVQAQVQAASQAPPQSPQSPIQPQEQPLNSLKTGDNILDNVYPSFNKTYKELESVITKLDSNELKKEIYKTHINWYKSAKDYYDKLTNTYLVELLKFIPKIDENNNILNEHNVSELIKLDKNNNIKVENKVPDSITNLVRIIDDSINNLIANIKAFLELIESVEPEKLSWDDLPSLPGDNPFSSKPQQQQRLGNVIRNLDISIKEDDTKCKDDIEIRIDSPIRDQSQKTKPILADIISESQVPTRVQTPNLGQVIANAQQPPLPPPLPQQGGNNITKKEAHRYNGKLYRVRYGPRGGKYIVVDKKNVRI